MHGTSHGLSRIVAVVATRGTVEEAALRADVSQIIPGYMVPNVFYILDQLPKNANGKIDRKKLKDLYAPAS